MIGQMRLLRRSTLLMSTLHRLPLFVDRSRSPDRNRNDPILVCRLAGIVAIAMIVVTDPELVYDLLGLPVAQDAQYEQYLLMMI